MHNFFEPSTELLDKVKQVFLKTDSAKLAKSSVGNESNVENYIDSLERKYQEDQQKLILNPSIGQQVVFKPRYYMISKTKTKDVDSSLETKLDGMAINILCSSNTTADTKNKDDSQKLKLDYNCLYSSLLKLLDAGVKLFDKNSTLSLEVNINLFYF